MARDLESSPDPVYRSALRESRWILVLWLINMLWVVGYCSLFGYHSADEPLTTVLGMPSWVFGGIFMPWIVATTVISWFALTQIEDHPLHDPAPADEESEEQTDG